LLKLNSPKRISPSLLSPTIAYISANLSVCSTFLSNRILQSSQATDGYTQPKQENKPKPKGLPKL